MGKKFDTIYESVVSRGEVGGYLPGDCVVFKKSYKSTDTYKKMPSTLQKEIDGLATCGLNIKVIQVGDKLSGASAGNVYKAASDVVLTIAADHGGGRTYGRVTVTPDMVDSADYANGVPVPDQFKRKDQVIIKPKKLKIDPNIITNVTDKGNGKNTPTNLKLAGESKSWESMNELTMIYEETLREKFNFKKADRDKDGKVSDWEEKIGKKIFGDDEENDDEEEEEQSLRSKCQSKAKSKYDVWPSAYASGYVQKCVKRKGKIK
jgi:hypothetical protein